MKPCSSSVISLQVGAASSYLAAELWLLRSAALEEDESLLPKYFHSYQGNDESTDNLPKPKTVFVDDSGEFCPIAEEEEVNPEDVLWAGDTKVIQQDQRHPRSIDPDSIMQTISMKRFHRKSFISCPRTRSTMQMPWFYARTDEDSSVLNATLDDALDSLRFFAEASDRLEAVDLTIDINSDLGLLAGKFIREIRDDYGTSVALPVTLLSNDDDLPALQRNMLAPEKNAQLLQSNLPLLYQDLVDNASLIISLSTRPMFGESSTSIARKTNAKVLDTILSFRGNGCLNGFDSDATIIQSTHEYIEKACSNRKFPIAVVEAWNAELVESVFNEDSIFKSLQQLKAHNVATANDFILNPFLRLMSPLNISTNITYEKPYANFLSITGSAIKDIPRKLFMECFDSKYRMSGCAIYSPAKTSDDRFGEWWTAVGTSPLLAHHLKDVASSWNRISHHLKDQFAKVGLGVEDSKQIGELLLTMSEQYQN